MGSDWGVYNNILTNKLGVYNKQNHFKQFAMNVVSISVVKDDCVCVCGCMCVCECVYGLSVGEINDRYIILKMIITIISNS
uniref:Uncharacterized protein n=1 Tax=Anguilla anguilla TaxID=7936 RepID=A0A0E9SU25_ANGAN